jgi:chromosome segregation ATPase
MTDKAEEIAPDVESLGMSLGKRLGRLEVSGVEVVEQLVGLVDRSEVVEEALVEEHIAREKIEFHLKQVGSKANGIEKEVAKMQEEKTQDKDQLKTRMAKLEEEHMEFKNNFLHLVESCHVMQGKLDLIEGTNVKLVMEVKELQKEKETLVKSLTYTSQPLNSSPKPVSLTTTPSPALTTKVVGLTNSPPMTQPPPPLGAGVRRRSPVFQVRNLTEL